jgi:acetylornithine deacetylase/succinyl-diaminopimelate desuccinylase family protein
MIRPTVGADGLARLRSRDEQRVVERVEALRDELVEAVSAAVRIPSVNPKYPGQQYDDVVGREGEAARHFGRIYSALGCEVDCFAVEPGRENCVGVWRGGGRGRSLIFNGHVDVVPPGDAAAWSSGDPFDGRVADGRVWGRGSTDMKGGLAAQAFAARAIADAGFALEGDLVLEAVVGEEVGDHLCGTTATVERGYRADAAVVSEPSAPPIPLAVVPVTPGLLWLSITVEGRRTHSAMRGRIVHAGGDGAALGVSAIDKGMLVYRALAELEAEWGQAKLHPLYTPGHFTLHPGVVSGAPSDVPIPFLIPDRMVLEYSVLHHPEEPGDAVRREIAQQVARAARLDPWLREHPPRIEWKLEWPPSRVAGDHPIVTETLRAHERATEGTPHAGPATLRGFAGVDDATWLNLAGIPAITYGPGDLRTAHAVDEHVSIEELVAATRTYALLAMAWCGYGKAHRR